MANIRTIGLTGLAPAGAAQPAERRRGRGTHERGEGRELETAEIAIKAAQRLARRLCTCKAPVTIPSETPLAAGFAAADLDGTWQPWGSFGCERCKGSGYKGRVGIYQVMPISEEIQRIIMRGGNAIEIAEQA